MKRVLTIFFGALLLAGCVRKAPALGTFAVSSLQDAEIDGIKKAAIDSAGLTFIRKVFGPSPTAGLESFAKGFQNDAMRRQLEGMTAGLIRPYGPRNPAIQHTYLIELKFGSPGRVICASDLSKPDGWVSLAAKDIPEQAYVLMSADTTNNKLAVVVWLVPEQNNWKVLSFSVNLASLANMDSVQLWRLAREQRVQAGHNFNAALLYAAAKQLANRGPNFQLAIAQSISEDMPKVTIPAEIRGQPPFFWKDGDSTFKVMQIGPIAIGGKIYVNIVHQVEPWQSTEQVEKWNRALLGDFKRRFPEYSDVFAGLVARAVERGSNRGYGTVDVLP